MFVLLQRECKHKRLRILENTLCDYVYLVVYTMYTCNRRNFGNKNLCLFLSCCRGYVNMQDWEFWKQYLVFMFVLLQRVSKHTILGILATRNCVYVCVVVESIYTFKNGHFCNQPLCLWLCCSREYVNMWDLLLATSHCVYDFVVVDGMYRCKIGNFGNKHLCL